MKRTPAEAASHAAATTASTVPAPPACLGKLRVSDGSLEALKWIAAILMIGDHLNRHLYAGQLPFLFEAGRLAMPIFAFVLASHLARPDLASGSTKRTIRRMLVSGAFATPAYVVLVGWWPLNIMFALALSTAAISRIQDRNAGRWQTVALVLLAGAWVEFWWPAVLTVITAWRYMRDRNAINVGLWLAAVSTLAIINGNHWALASFAIIIVASRFDIPMPRLQKFFYVLYPAHLAAIVLLKLA